MGFFLSFFCERPPPYTQKRNKTMAQENKIRIGYWKIRGLAAPLRMIMVYLGKDFDDVMYELQGSPGNWDGTAWFGNFFFLLFWVPLEIFVVIHKRE